MEALRARGVEAIEGVVFFLPFAVLFRPKASKLRS